jgi:hypothetical protein
VYDFSTILENSHEDSWKKMMKKRREAVFCTTVLAFVLGGLNACVNPNHHDQVWRAFGRSEPVFCGVLNDGLE